MQLLSIINLDERRKTNVKKKETVIEYWIWCIETGNYRDLRFHITKVHAAVLWILG